MERTLETVAQLRKPKLAIEQTDGFTGCARGSG